MSTGPELIQSLLSGLRKVADANDISVIMEPRLLAEARELRETLSTEEPDLETCHLLGIFHWYRSLVQGLNEGREDLELAIGFFVPCFFFGVGEIPEPLLPMVADDVEPSALELVKELLRDPDSELLEDVIRLWRRMLDATPSEHPERATRLTWLARSLRARFERLREAKDLDAAIEALQEATRAVPVGHPQRPWIFSQLGIAAKLRFGLSATETELDAAISAFQIAVEISPSGDPETATENAILWMVKSPSPFIKLVELRQCKKCYRIVAEIEHVPGEQFVLSIYTTGSIPKSTDQ